MNTYAIIYILYTFHVKIYVEDLNYALTNSGHEILKKKIF